MKFFNFFSGVFSCHKQSESSGSMKISPKSQIPRGLISRLVCSCSIQQRGDANFTEDGPRRFVTFELLKTKKFTKEKDPVLKRNYKYLETIFENRSLSTLHEEVEEPEEMLTLTNEELNIEFSEEIGC